VGILKRIAESVWHFLISLRLAVCVILSLAVSLAVATTIESKYDTATAQYFVYQARWFYALLTLLGLNILAVALSRLPWKWRQSPFLMAHAGILMILTGSYMTATLGLDGNLRIGEGEVNSAVELNDHVLLFREDEDLKTKPFPWMPASVAADFKGVDYPDFKIRVEKYISDAESKVNFVSGTDPERKPGPAIQIRILGAPMGGAPEIWLWGSDPGWATQKMGLARFVIRKESQKDLTPPDLATAEARLDFVVSDDGQLKYEATSIRGEKKSGKIDLKLLASKEEPVIVDPQWRMPIKIQVKRFIPMAINTTEYVPVGIKPSGMGSNLPQPAMLVSLLSNPKSKLWLGLGDRADFNDPSGKQVSIGLFPRRVVLPYAIRLKQFEMKHDPGTQDAAAYSSFVQVVDSFQKDKTALDSLPVEHITMNEPMSVKGYTFYQASYIPDSPRPTVTVLSVNHDPGRPLKYWGSVLLVLGSIALYVSKAFPKIFQRKKSQVQMKQELPV
jgi:hypothetical protein